MSLDIAILDDEGTPSCGVAVSPDCYSQLMQQAEVLALPQLSRMDNYYQDVDYTVQDTLLLQQETEALAAHCSGKSDYCALVDQLQNLVHLAVSNNKAVVAIAD